MFSTRDKIWMTVILAIIVGWIYGVGVAYHHIQPAEPWNTRIAVPLAIAVLLVPFGVLAGLDRLEQRRKKSLRSLLRDEHFIDELRRHIAENERPNA